MEEEIKEETMDYLFEINDKNLDNKPKIAIPYIEDVTGLMQIDKHPYEDSLGKLVLVNGEEWKVTEVNPTKLLGYDEFGLPMYAQAHLIIEKK